MKAPVQPQKSRLQPFYRIVSLVLLVTVTPLMTACYGNFPLTKFIYEFNGDIGDEMGEGTGARLIQSIVMWIFVIIPVYGIAMLADAFIFNLVEFWTGEPVELSSTTTEDGSTVTLAPGESDDVAVLTLERDGEVKAQHQFVRLSPEVMEVRSMEGELLGKMERAGDGRISFLDADGNVLNENLDQSLLTAGASIAG